MICSKSKFYKDYIYIKKQYFFNTSKEGMDQDSYGFRFRICVGGEGKTGG